MKTETPGIGLHRIEAMSKERVLEFSSGERLLLSASLEFLARHPNLQTKRQLAKQTQFGPWMGVYKEDVTATKRKFGDKKTWRETWEGDQGKFTEHDLWALYLATFVVLGDKDKKPSEKTKNQFLKATRRLHGKLLLLRGFDNHIARGLLAA